MNRYAHDIRIAIESIFANKIKSILTALGIIFGVAAVISMLAIGAGTQQEILQQIKLVGSNNIVITPTIILDDEVNEENRLKKNNKFSSGLSMRDVDAISDIIPSVVKVSPEISNSIQIIKSGKLSPASLIGVDPVYFGMYGFELHDGRFFSDRHNDIGAKVCVIGENLQQKIFFNKNPIGETIKCDNVWFTIIGVVKNRQYSTSTNANIKLSNSNQSVFIPISSMLLHYENRALILSSTLKKEAFDEGDDVDEEIKPVQNYNQLDKIVVQINNSENMSSSAAIIERLLLRRHSGVKDFHISIPEMFLKQEQKTKDIFNIVLSVIAGISLLVGGIGIMNIMLASVMERIKEIGVRLAIGATKKDIIVQFLAESAIISILGGFIGVLLGVLVSVFITKHLNILTIISATSVVLAFGISASVGIIFGYMPAKIAAEKNPVSSLRYE